MLLRELLGVGRAEEGRRITGFIHPDNFRMRRVCEKVGFHIRFDADEGLLEALVES